MTEAIHLGPPGTQVELAYPDSRPETVVVRGRIIEKADGSKVLHHASAWGEWSITWTDLTEAEKDEIKTEYKRLQELSFVIGSVSYPILCQLGSYRDDPVPGSSPILYNVSISLTQSS